MASQPPNLDIYCERGKQTKDLCLLPTAELGIHIRNPIYVPSVAQGVLGMQETEPEPRFAGCE